jgi:hypothetical protein
MSKTASPVMESERVHRAVNVCKQPHEQVTIFLLDRSDAVAQATEEQVSESQQSSRCDMIPA